jgi:hypothetical protein
MWSLDCCFAALAMTAGLRRELPAEFGVAGSRGEYFPGCKALKSHKMRLESVDVTKAWDQHSFVRGAGRPAVAYRADRDRRARRRREASPKPLRSRPIVHLSNRGVSIAGIAAREGLDAKRSRPENGAQRLENIESALGNGSVLEASKPQDVVHGRGAHRALRLTKGGGLGMGREIFRLAAPWNRSQPRNNLENAAAGTTKPPGSSQPRWIAIPVSNHWPEAPPVIARSPCDKAIQGPRNVAPGLLRCARNDGFGVGSIVSGRRLTSTAHRSGRRNQLRIPCI